MLTKKDLIDALEPINKRLDGLEKGQQSLLKGQKNLVTGQKGLVTGQKNLEKKLDQHMEDTTDFFHQTWLHIDQIKALIEKRIKRIEDHLNLPPQ